MRYNNIVSCLISLFLQPDGVGQQQMASQDTLYKALVATKEAPTFNSIEIMSNEAENEHLRLYFDISLLDEGEGGASDEICKKNPLLNEEDNKNLENLEKFGDREPIAVGSIAPHVPDEASSGDDTEQKLLLIDDGK